MNWLKTTFALLAISMIGFNANSARAELTEGFENNLKVAVDFHNGTINEFQKFEFAGRTQNAMNFMVETAAYALELYGYQADADQVRSEWKNHFENYFYNMLIDDVGDHAPLSQWFADLYKKLRLRFGDDLLARMHLDDVNTLNYTIPVVFQPKGDKKTGEIWNSSEYKLHFVPFASIVTYWGSYGACTLLTKERPQIRKYCKKLAGILRVGMRDFVAPRLSDYIFKTANKQGSSGFEYDENGLDNFYKSEFSKLPN